MICGGTFAGSAATEAPQMYCSGNHTLLLRQQQSPDHRCLASCHLCGAGTKRGVSTHTSSERKTYHCDAFTMASDNELSLQLLRKTERFVELLGSSDDEDDTASQTVHDRIVHRPSCRFNRVSLRA